MLEDIVIRRDGASVQATVYGESDAGVILCPPHPLYGGNRFDARLVKIAEQLVESDISAVALDYHSYTGGHAEIADVLTVVSHFKGKMRSLGLLGYSYGSVVASNAAVKPRTKIKGLSLISPIRAIDSMELDLSSDCPKLMVYGRTDSLVAGDFDELYSKAKGEKEKLALDTDHFYGGVEEVLAMKVAQFFRRVLLAHQE